MTDIEWLVNWYIEHIPGPVQELLGDATTTTNQLLEHLPRVPACEKRYGCYVDLAKHQTTEKVRRYVGSGTSKDGVWSRMRCYIRQEQCSYEDCTEQGIHQRWIGDPEVKPDLFALALIENDPKHKPFVLLLEAIFMVMMRSIDLAYTPFEYFPQAAIDFVGDCATTTAQFLYYFLSKYRRINWSKLCCLISVLSCDCALIKRVRKGISYKLLDDKLI